MTVTQNRFVDEGAVIVDNQSEHRKRQLQSHIFDSRCDQRLLAHNHGGGLSPTGSDVRYHQTVRVATAYRLATMRHHIHLEEAWRRIVPITERSHRYAFSQRCIVDSRSAPALPANIANRLQKSIHRCRAHNQKATADLFV